MYSMFHGMVLTEGFIKSSMVTFKLERKKKRNKEREGKGGDKQSQ